MSRGALGSYAKIKNLLFVLNIAWTLIFFFVMAYSFSRPLRDMVNFFTGNSIIVITIYFFLFYVLYFLFSFWLKYIEGFMLENRIKHRQLKFKIWLRRLIAKEAMTFALLLVGVQVIYFFLETSVDSWWIPMAILTIITRNVAEFLPNWVVPYYSRHRDLDDKFLSERLHKLANRAGITFSRILLYKDSKARAAIVGFQKTKQLILSEALLEYAVEEVEVLVAMELARMRKGYLWKKPAFETAGMFITYFVLSVIFTPACEKFGFQFIFDVETLPVLIGGFFVIFVVVFSILNIFKRDLEKENDEYTLWLSKAPEAFVSLIVRESQIDIYGDKAIYFFDKILSAHPSVSQRLMHAQDYAQGMLFEEMHRK